ncbi:MAG: sugar phosphate isomerase/epimerase [Planctomycetes bacterium]|nr:sugar phosphate isomerase/epimerase [Planctomycetota bacterium]
MRLGLFSVSYAGYWGQERLPVEAFIARAALLGYESVMLAGKRPHLSPLDADDRALDRVRGVLGESGVACAAIAAYTDLSPSSAAEVPTLEMQIAYVDALARIAQTLGASIVRVFTAYESEGHAPHAQWRLVVDVLREMSDRVAERGIVLAVQNHHDIALDANAALELLHDVDRPNCRLAFDAWSPALRGEPLYETAVRMAPHTVMTTNADYVRFARYRYQPAMVNYERAAPDLVRAVRFGDGFIDYPAFFRGLRDGGFNGLANYEMCSPLRGGGSIGNLDAHARHYVDWMRGHVGPRAESESP